MFSQQGNIVAFSFVFSNGFNFLFCNSKCNVSFFTLKWDFLQNDTICGGGRVRQGTNEDGLGAGGCGVGMTGKCEN